MHSSRMRPACFNSCLRCAGVYTSCPHPMSTHPCQHLPVLTPIHTHNCPQFCTGACWDTHPLPRYMVGYTAPPPPCGQGKNMHGTKTHSHVPLYLYSHPEMHRTKVFKWEPKFNNSVVFLVKFRIRHLVLK